MYQYGLHVTASNGLNMAAMAPRALGVKVFQTMLGDGHAWNPYRVTEESANSFKKLTFGLYGYVHLPYTLNPCIERSHPHYKLQKAAIRRYGDLSLKLGFKGMVIHPGYKKSLSEDAAFNNMIHFMSEITGDIPILIETDSGSKNGSCIGSPEFILKAIKLLDDETTAMVVDTQHMFGRGVDLWETGVREDFIGRYGRHLALSHLNAPDEGVELGSFRDAHNTPFESYNRDSGPMIKDLLSVCRGVVERRSMSVAEKDIRYIDKLLAV